MLYNLKEKRLKRDTDCNGCDYFDNATKTCNGFGAVCFQYDPITNTCVDPITKQPFLPKEQSDEI